MGLLSRLEHWAAAVDFLEPKRTAFLLCFALLLIYRPLRQAERRFCVVGLPAGSRESRVGPWMARHGVPTERNRSEGT